MVAAPRTPAVTIQAYRGAATLSKAERDPTYKEQASLVLSPTSFTRNRAPPSQPQPHLPLPMLSPLSSPGRLPGLPPGHRGWSGSPGKFYMRMNSDTCHPTLTTLHKYKNGVWVCSPLYPQCSEQNWTHCRNLINAWISGRMNQSPHDFMKQELLLYPLV